MTYNLLHAEAEKMIEKSDKERSAYCKTFTGKEWTDALNYDISIDTSKLGIDKTIGFIQNYLKLTPFLENK
jgi:cytidylate kinase